MINGLKVKASDENVRLWYKHKLTDVYAIHLHELHQLQTEYVSCQHYTCTQHQYRLQQTTRVSAYRTLNIHY